MKKNITLFTLFLCIMATLALAQPQPRANPDSICVLESDVLRFDLSANDFEPFGPIALQDPTECFSVEGYDLIWSINKDLCPCGKTYFLGYTYLDDPTMQFAPISVQIKCDKPKPECFLNNLRDVPDPGSAGQPSCLYSCEFSTATYFVPHVLGTTYSWSVPGAISYTTNIDGNEIYVNWGPMGSGTIILTTTVGGSSHTETFCVEILDSPEASFTKTTDCVCLGGSISFTNTSIGASSFLWDFGDGNTSANPNPTHPYTTPGTYDVILYAFNNNFDPRGNPLCCCSDSTTMQITVDPDEGPNIYWISTLCPGDKSYYWTDAVGCGLYDWEVFDEDGNLLTTWSGDGTDSICVTWGGGPFGTISLAVSGCSTAYCTKPTIALVPIISAVSPVTGDDIVCQNSTATYTLPKWPNVEYTWLVTGGMIVSGQGTNTVTINWGLGPIGTIHVDYGSEFLGGIKGHEPSDCEGVADLNVSILPEFQLFGPPLPITCVNSMSSFTALPAGSYTWNISPATPFTPTGPNSIDVTWSSGPGQYVVSATTNDPAGFCNFEEIYVMTVIDLEVPDSIVGETEICPGETYTYLGYTSTPNTQLNWTVTGGTPTTGTGSPIMITWDASGPYGLSLSQTQIAAPMCTSDPISLVLDVKEILGPLTFFGGPACINTQQSYSTSTVQHADAELEWKISPITAGSVIMDQGTLNPKIQWNNDPGMVTLTYCVTLCGQTQTHSEMFMLNAPVQPVINQVGDLCPGVDAVLEFTPSFPTIVSQTWSGPVTATTADITITTGGTYVVTTIDNNGCVATASYEAFNLPGPVAKITTPDPRVLCLDATGKSTTLFAETNPNYIFTWFCDGVIVQGPSTAATYTHNGNNTAAAFNYCAVVQDITTQCTTKSNVITVTHQLCQGGCNSDTFSLSLAVANPAPNCDIANFTVTASSNVTFGSWDFDDPANNTNSGTLANAVHQYSRAGCYLAVFYGSVPNLSPPPPACAVSESIGICIPLVADFEFNDDCQEVCFTDLSTFIAGNDITDWDWDFGDANSSISQNPCHIYSLPGTYLVTLTIENAAGCIVTKTRSVTVTGPPNPTVNINPNPACVGDPISFMASGAGIINYFWDFDDGSTNGAQNPSHTYLSDNVYNVTLIVTDARGCKDTVVTSVVVHPNPMEDTITYSPSLIVCEGETVTLTAPVGPYTYAWSNSMFGSSINVTTSGDYHVTVTDANNCMMVTDPVTVIMVPPPAVEITGPLFICDDGCVTLTATAGAGYRYQWLDAGMVPFGPPDTNQTFEICDVMPLPMTVFVAVQDAYGCSTIAGPFTVSLASSPSFTISTIGDLCEGSPNFLSVPILADVKYQWSTGETGANIIAILAGQYTVIGTDTITNCSSSASVTINPLPDLCIMPTGCYTVCNPDTLCGPDSMQAYQWNMNGTAIPGATSQCYIVTVTGSYSLTATNEFNCSLTSDTLILMVMECTDCVDQAVTASSIQNSECCYSLSYFNGIADIYGLMMHTGDANIDPDLGSLNPALSVFTIGSNYIGLVSTSGPNLPTGALNNYLEFCLSNVTNIPQQVIFDWYNADLDIVCSDTLYFDCPETDCIYLDDEFIYCEGDQVYYNFEICNSNLNTFTVNYLTLDIIGPAGIIVTPTSFDLTGSPLFPNTCQIFTVMLNGSSIANKNFCFNVIGHLSDPLQDPDALCCSLDSMHCIQIPGCNPCDNVYVESTRVTDTTCCYDINLINNFDPTIFSGVGICALTPGTTLSINNPFGSDWYTNSFTPTNIDLLYAGTAGSIPLGLTSLPEICITNTTTPVQLIEIKWMNGSLVQCRDTLELRCEPPCGFMVKDSVYCAQDQWIFEGYIKNTSPFTMSSAFIAFQNPSFSAYNQTISLGSLPPGGTFGPFFITIGAPASPGQIVCIDVTMHEVGHNNQHVNCCTFEHCFEIPDCGFSEGCFCDADFEKQVAAGFSCDPRPNFEYAFSPLGNLKLCDKARWVWDDGSSPTTVLALTSILHTFPGPGSYEVCMLISRTADDGKKCKAKFCKEIEVKQQGFNIFPNPTTEAVTVEWKIPSTGKAHARLFTPENHLVQQYDFDVTDNVLKHEMSLQNVVPGLYFLMIELNGVQSVEKLVVF